MVLADPDMLPYWMTVYFYMLCIYYICMQILSYYRSTCTFMYGMSYHYTPFLIKLKQKYFPLVMCVIHAIFMICHVSKDCPIYTSVGYCHIIIFDCHCVMCEYFCWLLGAMVGFIGMLIYICLCCFSYKKSYQSYCYHIP